MNTCYMIGLLVGPLLQICLDDVTNFDGLIYICGVFILTGGAVLTTLEPDTIVE